MSFWGDDHRVLWHGVGAGSDDISARVCAGYELLAELLDEFANVFESP